MFEQGPFLKPQMVPYSGWPTEHEVLDRPPEIDWWNNQNIANSREDFTALNQQTELVAARNERYREQQSKRGRNYNLNIGASFFDL